MERNASFADDGYEVDVAAIDLGDELGAAEACLGAAGGAWGEDGGVADEDEEGLFGGDGGIGDFGEEAVVPEGSGGYFTAEQAGVL